MKTEIKTVEMKKYFNTITLPQTSPKELLRLLTFKRHLGSFSWTGNSAGSEFHFTFDSISEFNQASKILQTIEV